MFLSFMVNVCKCGKLLDCVVCVYWSRVLVVVMVGCSFLVLKLESEVILNCL